MSKATSIFEFSDALDKSHASQREAAAAEKKRKKAREVLTRHRDEEVERRFAELQGDAMRIMWRQWTILVGVNRAMRFARVREMRERFRRWLGLGESTCEGVGRVVVVVWGRRGLRLSLLPRQIDVL